ncbi:putative endonuclease V (deoxyinosine 3endonuclease) [Chthoniobacter flavus Ellin428]|uniref:Putative endonuclease V (Deoxyinosine 3endonuclease) n=1 Tax=Chthoniobacter flavus Ellin428 TaxID=497964 RepID=B4D8H1_9BACT|nr:endonuclease V [Chthoniobacter flavus]EDY17193.1 putative endonuclease V (deoxyinosine 3endonuclease) [Chthoniobacter flavus Ellin428]TCO86982.1 endonuclease V [Chthoniobacter flavus]
MLACLDVDYRDTGACAAAVVFRDWSDAIALEERTVQITEVQPYEPGQFYRRELPCLLAVLRTLPPIETVIIDGYVWLEGTATPGLGAHLHEALGGGSVIIGVAKTKFQGADRAQEILRGTSQKPLYVTAEGVPVDVAAERVRSMHGAHRIPTLLKRVDDLCRRG